MWGWASDENRFRGPCARSAAALAMPFRTFNCTTGIAAEWWIWQRVQVRRYAHDWNLGEPSLKWLSAKFRAVLAGLTASPESHSVLGLSSPNDRKPPLVSNAIKPPKSCARIGGAEWTASVMRRFSPSRDHRSERAKQCGRNIQKNGCRTTILSRFGETLGRRSSSLQGSCPQLSCLKEIGLWMMSANGAGPTGGAA